MTIAGLEIEPDILLKTAGALLSVLGTTIAAYLQYRKSVPKMRGTLKADLELLKTLKEVDPSGSSFKTLRESINSRIKEMYSKKGIIELQEDRKKNRPKQIRSIIIGAVWVCIFGYWTYKLNADKEEGFAWWSLLTGYITLMGLGIIFIAFEPARKPNDPNKDGQKSEGESEGNKEVEGKLE